MLMAVSVIPGLTWGVLGVLVASRGFGLLFAEPYSSAFDGPAVLVPAMIAGMAIGTPHAALFWRYRKPEQHGRIFERCLHIFCFGMLSITLGVWWGILIGAALGFGPSGLVLAIGLIYVSFPIGFMMSLVSVLPVLPLMATLTIIVWDKTWEWLESNKVRLSR